jgi:hypothetical protein
MPISAALIGGGASLLGGLLGGSSARRAAQIEADARTKAAELAAQEARFRPVGVTTRFGSSNFTTDPVTGRVTGAGYSLDPALRGMQNRFLGLADTGLDQAAAAQGQYAPLQGAAQGLFSLGSQYLAESPAQAAQKYMLGKQNLLAPSRERQYGQLQTNLFNTGRTGLAVGGTGLRPGGGEGLRASNPEMEAYYNAIAQQDAQIADQAMQAGQAQTLFGADLFRTGGNLGNQSYALQSAALGPYQAYLQGATGLETLGQQPFEMGSNLGRNIANPTGANALYQGGMGAASSMASANAYNPFATALTGLSQNRDLTNALARKFSGNVTSGFDGRGYGAGVNPYSGEFMGSLGF